MLCCADAESVGNGWFWRRRCSAVLAVAFRGVDGQGWLGCSGGCATAGRGLPVSAAPRAVWRSPPPQSRGEDHAVAS